MASTWLHLQIDVIVMTSYDVLQTASLSSYYLFLNSYTLQQTAESQWSTCVLDDLASTITTLIFSKYLTSLSADVDIDAALSGTFRINKAESCRAP